jgi:hypothetical protein
MILNFFLCLLKGQKYIKKEKTQGMSISTIKLHEAHSLHKTDKKNKTIICPRQKQTSLLVIPKFGLLQHSQYAPIPFPN